MLANLSPHGTWTKCGFFFFFLLRLRRRCQPETGQRRSGSNPSVWQDKKEKEAILRSTEMDGFDAMSGSAEEKPKL